MLKDRKITLVAILAITCLEGIALSQGINGSAFSVSIAVIAGLAGYTIKAPRK